MTRDSEVRAVEVLLDCEERGVEELEVREVTRLEDVAREREDDALRELPLWEFGILLGAEPMNVPSKPAVGCV